jgi:hypothetical protein
MNPSIIQRNPNKGFRPSAGSAQQREGKATKTRPMRKIFDRKEMDHFALFCGRDKRQ